MTEYRIKAYKHWLTLKEPKWPNVKYPEIDFQDIRYYSAPKKQPQLDSLDEVDPELLRTFEKLGIPIEEQKKFANVAVDAVFDSVSVKTTFQETLKEKGIIFSSTFRSIKRASRIGKEYLVRLFHTLIIFTLH